MYLPLASVTAAGNVKLPDDSKIFITDTDAPDGYPISGFTWVIIYKEQNYNGRSKTRATALAEIALVEYSRRSDICSTTELCSFV